MFERISILDEIKTGGYEASLITTFNAYLPFYEEVVWRKLVGQGVQHNVVLMDAAQCAHSIAHDPPRLAGRHYSLVPISSSGAFHPKVILLLGKNKGALLVGSHNLTLSGFGYNRELTNLIRVRGRDDHEAISIFQAVWSQVQGWVEAQGEMLPKHLSEMVIKLQDFAPWLKEQRLELPDSCQILSTQEGASSLFEQLMERVKGKVDQVLVSGAFFDMKLDFLSRIKQELNPREIIVGIDPKTVQMPMGIELDGISFRNANSLGDSDSLRGYLHAKSLVITTFAGEYYLATGSANPSAPAWLRPSLTGNTEMMFLRIGEEAEKAAHAMGLLELPQFPELTEIEWQEIEDSRQKEDRPEVEAIVPSIGICVATEQEILFQTGSLAGSGPFSCQVLGFDKQILCDGLINAVDNGLKLVVPDEILGQIGFVCCTFESKKKTFLVQHQRQIDECARTGSQRRFRDALTSLSSGSPDLETLISCVDKIIFSKADDVNRTAKRIKTISTPSQDKPDSEEGGDLSMDISDTRKSKKKYRLRHSDDLSYLLDVLIYHLRIEAEGVSHEKRDAKGRSEEEQVDADDEEVSGDDNLTDDEISLKSLSLCHGKVRSLVGRMINQFHALAEDKVSFEDTIVRLTGVLAFLRQLRNCDGRVSWVRQGQTAFPIKERQRLFKNITSYLFDGKNSVVVADAEYDDADELARLRGLVLWLAWDSDIHFIAKKAFDESNKEREERLRAKALMLLLAQLVKNDEVVIEEAKQSIGPLCSSDMDWLNWVLDADRAISRFTAQEDDSVAISQVSPGDIAYLPGVPKLGARVILRLDGGKVNLAFFDSEDGYKRYQAGAVKLASYDQLVGAF